MIKKLEKFRRYLKRQSFSGAYANLKKNIVRKFNEDFEEELKEKKTMKRQAIQISLAELTDLKVQLIKEAKELNKELGINDCVDYSRKWSIAIINKTPECSDTWEIESINSQQPEVIACQGEGESAESFDRNSEINSGYSESGTSEEYPSADINNIIDKERRIWQQANPESRTLLKKFANKIKLEIELGGHKKWQKK